MEDTGGAGYPQDNNGTSAFRAQGLLFLWEADGMARGWESKAVESQIEAAEQHSYRGSQAPRPSKEQLQMERDRESIELSRTRVLHDLASATNPKYRVLLERSLEFLDQKLRALGPDTSKPNRSA